MNLKVNDTNHNLTCFYKTRNDKRKTKYMKFVFPYEPHDD